ncbi:hypothetical protein GXM_06113 [Nostoc sphaeroides CCNUC1]|uniref:Uncharacterized protein n=1 Tax=Nostoc sphaeroides CCNUC1 TaxID=2653204 RepID=A0A5P8W9H6_9NOSO|nr:hypothetical protein GXM_06113 [Nostoc sphaeroides CCNUC1]
MLDVIHSLIACLASVILRSKVKSITYGHSTDAVILRTPATGYKVFWGSSILY